MSSSKRYRAAIVGLTGIGATRPAETTGSALYGTMPNSHTSAYHRHPQTDVVAVCDIRPEALSEFTERWSDVWPDVRIYEDFSELLRKETPDLVSVATPDHVHADVTVAAVAHGAQAVLCEKPIATSLADADRMIEATEAAGVPLSIEHTRRWDPRYAKVKEILDGGEIGALRTVVCELFSRRAMLFRNGTHYIDVINWLAGSRPSWVVGELEEGFEDWTEYRGDGGRDPDKDPYASAYIRFDNGVRAFFNAHKVDFAGGQFSLTCDDGRIEVSDQFARIVRSESHYRWNTAPIIPGTYTMQRQLAAVGELIDVLENGGDLVSPAREARKTLEIILAILRSNSAGNVRTGLPLT
jgi:predicted dehydrogenase